MCPGLNLGFGIVVGFLEGSWSTESGGIILETLVNKVYHLVGKMRCI